MKTVVVTGASRGLGAEISRSLATSGWNVVGLSRSGQAPSGVEAVACDVGEFDSVKSALSVVSGDRQLFGLINAAGIASMNLAISTPPDTVERIIRTNLIGTIHCCMVLAKQLIRNRAGRIINFSTLGVPIALKGESIYVASKAGVEGFSRSFAREMADFGITVNIIAPGPIDTDLIAKVPAKAIERVVSQQIIPREFKKRDVVDLVNFVLSPESQMLSGQVFNVGGA